MRHEAFQLGQEAPAHRVHQGPLMAKGNLALLGKTAIYRCNFKALHAFILMQATLASNRLPSNTPQLGKLSP